MDGGGAPHPNPRAKAQLAGGLQPPSLAPHNAYLPGPPGAAMLAFPPQGDTRIPRDQALPRSEPDSGPLR